MQTNGFGLKAKLRALALGALLAAVPSAASADDQRLSFWGFGGVEKFNVRTEDDGSDGSYASLDPNLVAEGMLRYRNDYSDLQSIRLDTGVRFHQSLDDDHDSYQRIRTRAEWRTWFSEEKQNEFRLRADHEYRFRDGSWYRNRIAGQAVFRHRFNRENLAFMRGRVSHSDYNEVFSSGSNGLRYLAELGHEWTPNRDWTRFRTRVGYQFSDAQSADHSYDNFYFAADARHHVSDETDVFGKFRVNWRDFGAPYDPPDPTVRSDQRFRATIGAETEITDVFSLIGELGWQSTESSIEERSVDGFVFRLGIEVNFEIWRSED